MFIPGRVAIDRADDSGRGSIFPAWVCRFQATSFVVTVEARFRMNRDRARPGKKGDRTMRFLTMVRSAETSGPPPAKLMEAIAKLGQEATRAGTLVETGGLLRSTAGARVRLSGGKLTVTDGPFTESKEVIGGYAIYELKSKEEAVEATVQFMRLHKEHWPGWEGESEVRQIFQAPDFASGSQP
jgi:hypothetical protein